MALPDGIPVLRITLAAFFSMIVAASYGHPLVVAFGPATTGSVRMDDVAVGAAFSCSAKFFLQPIKNAKAD